MFLVFSGFAWEVLYVYYIYYGLLKKGLSGIFFGDEGVEVGGKYCMDLFKELEQSWFFHVQIGVIR